MSTATVSYEPVIGFEVHVELCTATKVWCSCPTTFGGEPNTQVCPICLGLPGSLPVLNKLAMEYSIRTAIALNCEIPERCVFDRKNYYYPDLPKNYQISQQYAPLGVNGWVDLDVNGETKRVRINNIHLEEDAGQLLHPEAAGLGEDYSLVNLNRAGTPLLEIVSEPDLRSADEALAYMNTLKNLLEYLEVSDCKMQEGRLRFEVNISVREAGTETLGTKVEIKNLNSMKTALKCIEYETRRQSAMRQRGERILQETRLWDEPAGATRAMRSKEVANDYRYFPDPDLVEVHITEEWLNEIRAHLPELRPAMIERFKAEHALPEHVAQINTSLPWLGKYTDAVCKLLPQEMRPAAGNWIMTNVLAVAVSEESDILLLEPRDLASLIKLVQEGQINLSTAKRVDEIMKAENGRRTPEQIVRDEGLAQVSDTSELEQFISEVITENADAVEKVRGGQTKVIQALVGQVMKKSRGKANPGIVNQLLAKKLGL